MSNLIFDSIGKVDLDLQNGITTPVSGNQPVKTFLPTEYDLRNVLIKALQDYFQTDSMTSTYRWYQEATTTPTVNKIQIMDQFVDNDRWFPCVIVGAITKTRTPYSMNNFLDYYTDEFDRLWKIYGGGVNFNVTIHVASLKPGEEEYLSDLVTFGLEEPAKKWIEHQGYTLIPGSVAPGQMGVNKIAGAESNAYGLDIRIGYRSTWCRMYWQNCETIETTTVTNTNTESSI